VYNGENYLGETIDSILSKIDLLEAEIVVINDGSTDRTSEICAAFGNRIRYIEQDNQGEYAATNNGLIQAKGMYILVVSHDDPMLSDELIPTAIQILETNPEIVCTYPDWQIIDALGKIIDVRVVKEYTSEELIGRFNCLPGPGAIFRKKVAIEIGGRRKWKFVSDYDFWLRLSQRGDFKRIPGVHAQWRSHQNSTTVSQKSFEMASERIALMQDFVSSNKVESSLAKNCLSSAYYFAARLGFFSSKIPAKKWLLKSFRIRQGWPEIANPIVVLFILSLPFSKFILKFLAPFSRRLRQVF
jgi:glycosyltransferase involved in cell wall biosynthesis